MKPLLIVNTNFFPDFTTTYNISLSFALSVSLKYSVLYLILMINACILYILQRLIATKYKLYISINKTNSTIHSVESN